MMQDRYGYKISACICVSWCFDSDGVYQSARSKELDAMSDELKNFEILVRYKRHY
jgi:hypothetical protein